MQRSILAVSPNQQFLEQIRSHLEEGGRYRVQGVTSGADALELVSSTYYDLAILDAESSDVPFVPFTRDLVATQPGLKLLVFPPQNNPHHPVLTGLVANGFLNKPFFTPEVSRALKTIFQEPVEEPENEPELSNDLVKLWMQRPEMGIKRVEQLLGSTTAQTGLLVSQGKVIAGSGPSDDATIQMALNLLDIHHIGKESMELMRFIPRESDGGELLIYASQLINDVTLVLFYPPTSSVQLVRQEVYQVKEEFKQVYPTTGELRRDLKGAPESIGGEGLTQNIEDTQPEPVAVTKTEPGEEVLIPLEDEIGSDELDSILSLIELKNLDAMLADMPAPDPDAEGEQPVVEESTVGEPVTSTDGVESSGWVPFSEVQDETVPDIHITPDLANENSGAVVSPEYAEEMGMETPPPLPAEFLELQAAELPSEAILADNFDIAQDATEPAEPTIIEEEKVDLAEDTPEVTQVFPDFDFNLPWETAAEKAEIPETAQQPIEREYEPTLRMPDDEVQVPAESINPKDLDFNAWLDGILPATTAAEDNAVESLDQSEEVLPPLADEAQETEKPIEQVDADDDIASVFSEFEPLPDSIEFETEIQGSDENEWAVTPATPTEFEPLPDSIEFVTETLISDEEEGSVALDIPTEVEPLPESLELETETLISDEEEGSVPLVIPTEYEAPDEVLAQELFTDFTAGDIKTETQTVDAATETTFQPPPLPVESYNTNLSSEPGTRPLGIKNFRFNYSCLLIPRNPQQFLTRDLSERLSFLIPQLHLEYGWRLTGITIRPQYMLWSVSLPIDTCPVHLVRDIRRRTTAHITSNFTDLTPIGNSDDFWAPGFLILSGSTSPTVGMVSDFIRETRKNQNLND